MTSPLATLPVLSIQQPFAEAILAGVKSIELRTWPTHQRGLIVIHAGLRWYMQRGTSQDEVEAAYNHATATAEDLHLPLPVDDYARGALVGTARLVKTAHFTKEGWERLREAHRHNGAWDPAIIGWQLAEVERFEQPVPYLGQKGLFRVPLTALPSSNTSALATTVVHCQQTPYEVYIGRPGCWGNPFTSGEFGAGDAVDRYERWIATQPDLLEQIPTLKGKKLGCWCKKQGNERCHGDVLAAYANS